MVDALEEVVSGIGPMVEEEARVLSSAALTRVFSHLYLHDPAACLDELLEPVDGEHYAAAAEAVKGQVEAMPPRKEHLWRATAVSRGDLRLLSCFIPARRIMPRGGV